MKLARLDNHSGGLLQGGYVLAETLQEAKYLTKQELQENHML